MHVLVLRRTLAEANPDLAGALYTAFEAARWLAAADVVARDFPKLTLPWLSDHAAASRDALRGDPWTYGLEANRQVLETMLRYAHADTLSRRVLAPDELFA